MEIKKANLKLNGKLKTLYVSKVKYIMIHHTAHPTWDIYDTHNYHQKKGWVGIGYNFFINPDGTIFEGRGFNIGAGATGYNNNSIHVCFAGNFEKNEPSKTQIENGKALMKYLLKLVPKNAQIIGHKDIGSTACPGKYFPLGEFKNIRKETEKEAMLQKLIDKYSEEAVEKALVKLIESVNDDGKESEWAEKEFQEAKDLKITDGTNPEMFATRQEVAIMVKRAINL